MLTWTRSPHQGESEGQCLSKCRYNEWIRKSTLCLVTIILSFIWTRIELVSQKISEHRARVMLFVNFLFLCVCVCVCVCTWRHMNHDTNQLYMDHTQQPLEGTSRVICCPGSGVGILLNLDPVSIFWKLISCWLQHLQIFSSFPEAVFSVLFMVYLVLQILLTRSPLFLLLFPRL